MPVRRISLILALIVIVQLVGACTRETAPDRVEPANEAANSNRAIEPGMEGAKDNADELRTLINLPYEPEDLVWKDFGPAGPKGRKLLAVIQLTPEDTRKLIDSASKVRPGAAATIPSENWFPTELVTQSELRQGEGIELTSYAADDFFQGPFTEGTLGHVNETDFFVLELYAR